MEHILDDLNWTLEGFHKYVPLQSVTMETGVTHNNLTGKMKATVPGGVHYDLYRAGHIEHPYRDMNSLKAEWIENRWWVYRTVFHLPQFDSNWHKAEIIFKGLDYEAVILVNNHEVASSKGMFTWLVLDITEECIKGGSMSLTVVFKGIPDEMGQVGFTSRTSTQKSRFSYKWDFSTRLVNIGIWREIVFKAHEAVSLADVYCTTDYEVSGGTINISGVICGRKDSPLPCQICVSVNLDNKQILCRTFPAFGQGQFSECLVLKDPSLWYPNGIGSQPLYDIFIDLIYEDRIADNWTCKIGVRSLRYLKNDDAPSDSLPYTVAVNGNRMYIKGVNMVPLDHIYGNISVEHYEQMVLLAKNMNVNMIRIWGGGIFENEIFYDLCDRHGILIWQEFIQSSSGIDNIPAKNPAFLEELAENATQGIKEKRNHTALAIWCGGNELMDANNNPSNYTDMNIAMLRGLVEKYDPQRLFLPTSASGPSQNLSEEKGRSHDIHGWWEYLGNPEHYQRYYNSDSLLHSEFGTEGLSNIKTISKFISSEYLIPRDINDHVIWKHRGQWWDTYRRDQLMFGEITDMEHFQNASQWLQAEGLRFILEQNRSRKFRNSGSLIWQLNEPWPNITGTFLVDYCLEQKMAYYYAKKAYAPVHAILRYRKLDYAIGEIFDGELFLDSSDAARKMELSVVVQDCRGNTEWESTIEVEQVSCNATCKLPNLYFTITDKLSGLFFVTLISKFDGEINKNTYIFSTENSVPYAKASDLRCADIESQEIDRQILSDRRIVIQYKITNIGPFVALNVRAEEMTDCFWFFADTMFETIMPGDSVICTLTCTKKVPSGFMANSYDEESAPHFEFGSF